MTKILHLFLICVRKKSKFNGNIVIVNPETNVSGFTILSIYIEKKNHEWLKKNNFRRVEFNMVIFK